MIFRPRLGLATLICTHPQPHESSKLCLCLAWDCWESNVDVPDGSSCPGKCELAWWFNLLLDLNLKALIKLSFFLPGSKVLGNNVLSTTPGLVQIPSTLYEECRYAQFSTNFVSWNSPSPPAGHSSWFPRFPQRLLVRLLKCDPTQLHSDEKTCPICIPPEERETPGSNHSKSRIRNVNRLGCLLRFLSHVAGMITPPAFKNLLIDAYLKNGCPVTFLPGLRPNLQVILNIRTCRGRGSLGALLAPFVPFVPAY